MPYLLTAIGFLFGFVVPGYLVVITWFEDIPVILRVSLVVLLSVMLSTLSAYLTGLVFGWSVWSVLLSFGLYLPWLIWAAKARDFDVLNGWRTHSKAFVTVVILILIYLVAEWPGMVQPHRHYYTLSGVNWQDTAMHLGIVQSISQGNFPPQAPYFSGEPLSYYYFLDLHTAMLQTLFDSFAPRLLAMTDAVFIGLLFLTVYGLAHLLTRNRLNSWLSGWLVAFFGNMMWWRWLEDWYAAGSWGAGLQLLAERGYSIEYQQLMQVPPMADLFLQNRPFMVGLPAVGLLVALMWWGFTKRHPFSLLLSGFMVGMLIKFHLFAAVVGWLVAGLLVGYFVLKRRSEILKQLRLGGFFVLSGLLVSGWWFRGALFDVASKSLLSSVTIGPFEVHEPVWWLAFWLLNLGFIFVLGLVGLVWGGWRHRRIAVWPALLSLAAVLFAIPHTINLTLHAIDNVKFFHFMVIPLAIGMGWVLARWWQNRFGKGVVVGVVLVSSLTSMLALGHTFLNKREAYSQAEMGIGLWMRGNLPQNTVVVTSPTVHSPVTQIAGRLRVLSYTLWPYTHGFHQGEDSVFTRAEMIQGFYKSIDDPVVVREMMKRYGALYVYIGEDELREYPGAIMAARENPILASEYYDGSVSLFRLVD